MMNICNYFKIRRENAGKLLLSSLGGLLVMACCFLAASCSSDDNTDITQPVIAQLSPTEASPGQPVTLKGSNFGTSRAAVDGHVYFNGIEASDYLAWSDSVIVVSVPRGYTTGYVAIKVNGVLNTDQTRDPATKFLAYNEDNKYIHGTYTKYLMCADVVSFTGHSNPCDYYDTTGRGSVVGEMGNDASYKGSADAKSFALWDSYPGDYTIFKFTVDEKDVPAKFYVGFRTAAQVYDSYVNVEISDDLSSLQNNTTYDNNNSMDVEYSAWSTYLGPYSMGPYIIEKPGTYYIRFLMMNTNPAQKAVATLQLINIAN